MRRLPATYVLLAAITAAPHVAAVERRAAGKARASASAKAKPAGKKVASAHAPVPHRRPQIDLLSIDLAASVAHVELLGVGRAPQARFFTIIDERRRRIVPPMVECQRPIQPPQGSAAPQPRDGLEEGRWSCVLTIPRIYQRAALVGISVEVRGQTLSVSGDKVQAAWAEARARSPLPRIVERPGVPGPHWGRTPDGGVPLDRDAPEQESESEQE